MRCIVYGLHAGDGLIRYVGQTKWTLKRRLQQHVSAARDGGDWPVCRWIRKHELRVFAVVLVADAVWNTTEIQQIARYRAEGFPLLNATAGGEGFEGFELTATHREKLSAAAVARAQSPAGREQLRRAARTSWEGHTPTPKRSKSEAAKARAAANPESILKAAHASRVKSSEHRSKLAGATSALWSDPEYRAKVLAGHASFWTPERRAAQAERARQQHAKKCQSPS